MGHFVKYLGGETVRCTSSRADKTRITAMFEYTVLILAIHDHRIIPRPPPTHPIHCSQSLYVEVLEQNYVVVVTRAGAGLPLSFRVLRAIFSISVLFALSWIPRIAVLLFFPQWVDPACSPVYCHRKLLVSRGATAAAAI